jgi:hypothetical protein
VSHDTDSAEGLGVIFWLAMACLLVVGVLAYSAKAVTQ